METFNIAAGLASILGLFASLLAFLQARKASAAAVAARDAVMIRTLVDELEVICVRAEQLVDFLVHGRFDESALRIAELVSGLSEMPRRRSPYLDEEGRNSLLTSREQLHGIGDAVQGHQSSPLDSPGKNRVIGVARRVVASLREVSGEVKSRSEIGAER
jgi:hypothetical protein